MDGNWQGDLERWLAPFLAALRHKTHARMCPADPLPGLMPVLG